MAKTETVHVKSSDVSYPQWMAYVAGKRSAPVQHDGLWYRPIGRPKRRNVGGSGQTEIFEFLAEQVSPPKTSE